MKDLQKIVQHVSNNNKQYIATYGSISTASLGAIQRGLVAIEHDGVGTFFGEPALDINDFIQTEGEKGVINILASDKLLNSPKVYSTFLLWLMTKLFETLPEVGDLDKPKMVFFFDEAHLLFNDAPKILLEKIEQVVRLIRSKGIGIYFISQTPSDIPDSVLGQLGNRIQHALRAYTPKDQKALKVAAQTFRANPKFDTEKAISELGIGEALVSLLDEKGTPQAVERAFILPPQSQIGPLDSAQREEMVKKSLLYRHYADEIDRESAYEKLSDIESNTLSEKEEVIKKKQEEKENKEIEKQQKQEEKEKQKNAAQRNKFWGTLATAVLVPIAKKVVDGIFSDKTKVRKKRK